MAAGFKRIQKQFLILTGLFVILTLGIHLIPTFYDYHNKVLIDLDLSMPIKNLELVSKLNNYTRSTVKHNSIRGSSVKVDGVKKSKIDIWKVDPDDDRIVAQIQSVPTVSPELPPKRILLAHGVEGWSAVSGRGTFVQHSCPIQNCELLGSPVPGQPVDARMFKEIDLNSFTYESQSKLTPRHPDQVWIMFALESPEATPSYDVFKHVINWTATYRHDSTMMTPYDKFLTFDNFTTLEDYKPDKNYAQGKSKLAAIFVSNCYASNDRLGFIKALQKYIPVDVYGFCGTLTCDKYSQQSCFDMLKKDYKFYFSFENANCRDYITEKLFLNALRHDVVPVVMGAHPDDYKRVAPAGSYIHVEDFSNAKELADYLLKLSKDDDEYNKYFRWKQIGTFFDTKFWCRICSLLWDPDKPRLSVPDLESWWRGPNICIGKKRWDQVLPKSTESMPLP